MIYTIIDHIVLEFTKFKQKLIYTYIKETYITDFNSITVYAFIFDEDYRIEKTTN